MDYKRFILIIVVILLIYVIYTFLTKSNSPTSMNNAKNQVTILANNVDPSSSNSVNYGMTIWFYVENWDYNYGQMKTLLSRGYNPSIQCPSTCLQPAGCCITGAAPTGTPATCASGDVLFNCSDYTIQSYINDLSNNPTKPPYPLILLGDSINNLYILQAITHNSSNSSQDTLTNYVININSNYDVSVTLIENFPVQKWVNLTISFYGRTLDVYLDGKLVRTAVLANILYSTNTNAFDVLITPNGGFDGLTSGFQYYPNPINPTQAWDIYKKGYSTSMFGGLLNKYKIKFSLMDGDIEDQSFEI